MTSVRCSCAVLLVWMCGVFSFHGFSQSLSSLLPMPVQVQPTSGTFRLTAETALVVPVSNPEIRKVAAYVQEKIKPATGYSLPVVETSSAASQIQLVLNAQPDASLKKEGYTLDISPGKVVLKANQPAGLFYGLQTLLQLLPPQIESTKPVAGTSWDVPCARITDYPRFEWRGVMLDVSRHFFDKEYVKEFIDQIARYKFNTFHWHLADDNGWRIEIKSYPKLTEVGAWRVERNGRFGNRKPPQEGEKATYGGFYTQEDIKEVIRYAQDRYVTILPEIDVPGHSMAAIAAYPWLSCTKDPKTKVNPGTNFAQWHSNGTFTMFIDNSLNPADEKVYEFLDKVFGEIATLFPNPYIHMGGDECYHGFWAKNPECQALMKKMNLKNTEELQSYFVKRVEKIIQSKGKKLIGWDEILEGGLAPNATVMSWRGTKGGIAAAKQGHPVVMTPSPHAYIDLMQGDPIAEVLVYSTVRLKDTYVWNPVPPGVDSTLILGGQTNLWTEQIPNTRYVEYMTYPRAWALAEVYWTPQSQRDWNGFTQRLPPHFARADEAGINYARSAYNPIIKVSKTQAGKIQVALSTEMDGLDIHYSMDNTWPDLFYPKYTKPIEVPEGIDMIRMITYQNGKPTGKMLTLTMEEINKRVKK